jgi:spermidine synthase
MRPVTREMEKPLGRYRDLIFFASGFAGLIYESIWTHYLKLFLGHAAYAQTLVLVIFMGGMAVGAGVTGRYTARVQRPLRIYAVIEASIGILALAFHPVFVGTTDGFYDTALARHFDVSTFTAIKWSLATLLILPQSILLGATFPVFAAAATRETPAAEGRSIASLYFANSLGGAIGVLASGFLLVPSLGLPGTIATAGALNLAIAGIVYSMATLAARAPAPAPVPAPAELGDAAHRRVPRKSKAGRALRAGAVAVANTKGAIAKSMTTGFAASAAAQMRAPPALLIAASALTGAASFIYEVGWIRMLSLVLGSATHSFELMLSAFILGLAPAACGSAGASTSSRVRACCSRTSRSQWVPRHWQRSRSTA